MINELRELLKVPKEQRIGEWLHKRLRKYEIDYLDCEEKIEVLFLKLNEEIDNYENNK